MDFGDSDSDDEVSTQPDWPVRAHRHLASLAGAPCSVLCVSSAGVHLALHLLHAASSRIHLCALAGSSADPLSIGGVQRAHTSLGIPRHGAGERQPIWASSRIPRKHASVLLPSAEKVRVRHGHTQVGPLRSASRSEL
jgi:hypothetical protein